jgi:hypothetical protein
VNAENSQHADLVSTLGWHTGSLGSQFGSRGEIL